MWRSGRVKGMFAFVTVAWRVGFWCAAVTKEGNPGGLDTCCLCPQATEVLECLFCAYVFCISCVVFVMATSYFSLHQALPSVLFSIMFSCSFHSSPVQQGSSLCSPLSHTPSTVASYPQLVSELIKYIESCRHTPPAKSTICSYQVCLFVHFEPNYLQSCRAVVSRSTGRLVGW